MSNRNRVFASAFSTLLLLSGMGGAQAAKGSTCEITKPTGGTPPGAGRPHGLYHGNGKLWTVLWPDGTVVFKPGKSGQIRPDGRLQMKFPWWRAVDGPLHISGRRLDGAAAPLAAIIPKGYGNTGFQVSSLVFPTQGCWEVTGQVGDTALTFITGVRVERP